MGGSRRGCVGEWGLGVAALVGVGWVGREGPLVWHRESGRGWGSDGWVGS